MFDYRKNELNIKFEYTIWIACLFSSMLAGQWVAKDRSSQFNRGTERWVVFVDSWEGCRGDRVGAIVGYNVGVNTNISQEKSTIKPFCCPASRDLGENVLYCILSESYSW